MRFHLRSLALLLALDLLLFLPLLLNPTGLLYSDHSDLLAEHVPAKQFLVRSFHETGELPLWCPHQFAGSPFVHDIQVGMFYPPHLVLLALPEEAAGPALGWLVFLHLLLAGSLMYAYAIQRNLTPLPAFVSAAGFMFAGRWLMHLLGGGHYILIGLAWLPLMLLGWEKALTLGRRHWAILAGFAYALMTLSTQPQWTFYAGLFAACWTFGAAREMGRYFAWCKYGFLIVLIAVGLSAVQLLPTLEAARWSSRSGGVGTEGILTGGLNVVLFLFGPSQSVEPFNLDWEDRGGLGVLWVVAAVWAGVLGRGRTRYEAWVCFGLFAFAAGGAILFQALPGFNLFRQPARMMVIAGFPMAWLAGVATQKMFSAPGLSAEERMKCRRWALRIGAAALVLMGGFLIRLWITAEPHRLTPYVLAGPLLAALSLQVLKSRERSALPPLSPWGRGDGGEGSGQPLAALPSEGKGNASAPHPQPLSPEGRKGKSTWPFLWVLLLILDLALVLYATPVQVRDANDVFKVSACVRRVMPGEGEYYRILDFDETGTGEMKGTPLGSGAPLALLHGFDAVRGYSPLDVRHFRELVEAKNTRQRHRLGARDGKFTYPVISEVTTPRPVIDLLGVRYFLIPHGWMFGPGWEYRGSDREPEAFDFLAGGVRRLDTYSVWMNQNAFPRAFLVRQALPSPGRDELVAEFAKADFENVVYLHGLSEPVTRGDISRGARKVQIVRYEPNEVHVALENAGPGFLVLTDVWFSGWECTIDGEDTEIHRANHAFRAVEVPAGAHDVIFRFRPKLYERGRFVSFLFLGATLLLLVGSLIQAAISSRSSPPAGGHASDQTAAASP